MLESLYFLFGFMLLVIFGTFAANTMYKRTIRRLRREYKEEMEEIKKKGL